MEVNIRFFNVINIEKSTDDVQRRSVCVNNNLCEVEKTAKVVSVMSFKVKLKFHSSLRGGGEWIISENSQPQEFLPRARLDADTSECQIEKKFYPIFSDLSLPWKTSVIIAGP